MSSAGIVVLSVALGSCLVALASVLRSRRTLARRIASLSARVTEEGLEMLDKGSVEHVLTRLERDVDANVTEIGEARVARRRMEQALGALDDGVVLCDDQGHVVFVNEQATRLVGGDNEVQKNISALMLAAAEGKAETKRFDIFGPPRRSLSVTATPLDDNWRTTGAVAILQDISDQHRFDSVRREFVDNVSQELKTPVGALGVLADTLADEREPAIARRLTERIQKEARRVSRLIDDLLDLSRIEAEGSPVREPVALHLIVAQAAERVRPLAQQHGITINFGEPPQRLSLMGDRRQLVSAVFRLLDNAVKYSRFGSKVEVRARQEGGWVELSVRDHGLGIPRRDFERIFERFYRVDRTAGDPLAGPPSDGSGLGLAIVRHVAGNHGGQVHVDSTEGEGSTFTLRLPAGPTAINFTSAAAG